MNQSSTSSHRMNHCFGRLLLQSLTLFLCVTASAEWKFTEVAKESGLDYEHGYDSFVKNDRFRMTGGAASADFNGDGWPDLFVIRGDIGPNLLFVNAQDGTFRRAGNIFGLSDEHMLSSGAAFADIDGDRFLDLLVGGFEGTPPYVFRGTAFQSFYDHSATAGLDDDNNHYSYALGDIDRDGDLDLAATHWDGEGRSPSTNLPDERRLSIWRNEGDGIFVDISQEAGAREFWKLPYPFTPNFADINNDHWPDLLVASDFETSFIMINDGDGTFTVSDETVLTDENGMGAAVGDYDNDGDLDWFVSSIWDPRGGVTEGEGWGVRGNRLYQNRGVGDGTFDDVTDKAGVGHGYWGWGSCFADLNNDGHLDLFHVNGFVTTPNDPDGDQFNRDPSRLYISRGDGTFDERSTSLGLVDTRQGRGVVCFDYDMDGDIDLFVANNSQPPGLFRNDGGNEGNFLSFRLEGNAPNTEAIGARIYLEIGDTQQMREIQAGNNYVSSNPAIGHFGLGDAPIVDRVRIVWPSGSEITFSKVDANQFLVVSEESSTFESFNPHEQTSRRRGVRRRE
ncbi:MAG: CRTAC1 family protein, partial [Acidobacteria bacterium]|nr:CRTAC1 family protein [Acidobacteriota bacterium]